MSRGAPAGKNPEHYSYAHYASRDVAAGFDALRFSGPIGQFLLETQRHILLSALRSTTPAIAPHARVLDVGTGTGRAAISLALAGGDVVGVDASIEMLDVARARAKDAGAAVVFEPGDAHALPFEDRSFDLAVCLRVLMHTPDWKQCIAELCRVSRGTVVLDFPALGSLAALESTARRLRLAMGARVEAYRVMSERSVRASLAEAGFRVTATHRQFVLPIALHKKLGSLALTRATEGTLAAIGLRRALGSPVTMVAQR